MVAGKMMERLSNRMWRKLLGGSGVPLEVLIAGYPRERCKSGSGAKNSWRRREDMQDFPA